MSEYAVLIYADDSAHDAGIESDERRQADQHAGELAAAGTMVFAYALAPRESAVSIRSRGVTDGPFMGDGPVVVGFYVIEAPDLDAALVIAGTNPAIGAGGGVEVRPVHSGGTVERP
jgi:hypothetical protein